MPGKNLSRSYRMSVAAFRRQLRPHVGTPGAARPRLPQRGECRADGVAVSVMQLLGGFQPAPLCLELQLGGFDLGGGVAAEGGGMARGAV